jgi:hypothetical protein
MYRDLEGIHAVKAVGITGKGGDGTGNTTDSNDYEQAARKTLDNELGDRTVRSSEQDDCDRAREEREGRRGRPPGDDDPIIVRALKRAALGHAPGEQPPS